MSQRAPLPPRSSVNGLTALVRSEFVEMPGMRLTLQQACRLWNLDPLTCTSVLHALCDAGFLVMGKDGAFKRAAGRSA